LAGPDRAAVRALYDALEKERLRVFLDETSIDFFEPITQEIEDALRSSTALLAYYLRHYPSRLACQQELTAAFLARDARLRHDRCSSRPVSGPLSAADTPTPYAR
jgi:hypothetical protein